LIAREHEGGQSEGKPHVSLVSIDAMIWAKIRKSCATIGQMLAH
jgi:hypothetical protein